MKILIAYATGYGSTKEVAEFIGDLLEKNNHQTEIKNISEVESLNYDFLILGSAIKMDKILSETKTFLKKFSTELSQIKNAFFVLSITAKKESSENRDKITKFINPLSEVLKSENSPGIFAGKVDYQKIGWIWRKMAKADKTGNMEEGDFRNWDLIEKWVNELKI
ncbi:MAG: flavodoxin domain-containing protein [Rhodothermaceae bacterium]